MRSVILGAVTLLALQVDVVRRGRSGGEGLPWGAARGLSEFPCAGHDDGKEGTLAWHVAKPQSSPTSCWISSSPAVIRKPPLGGMA